MHRAGIEDEIWYTGEGNTRQAHIRAWWPGKKPKEQAFSMGDAVRAGLASKDTYKAWPDNMLLWRAVSNLAKQAFPEIGAGIYVFGEIPGDPPPDMSDQEAGPESSLAGRTPFAPGPDPLLAELSAAPIAGPAVPIVTTPMVARGADQTEPPRAKAAAEAIERPEQATAPAVCETPEHLTARRGAEKMATTRAAVCSTCGEEFPGENVSHPDSRPPDDAPALGMDSIRRRQRNAE
jgi:hypothetical protein